MVGAAPEKGDKNETIYIKNTNDLLSLANKSFNYGLRAYTFSMATIAWFINPLLFIFATAWVVAILYRREFRSKTLAAMNTVIDSYKK